MSSFVNCFKIGVMKTFSESNTSRSSCTFEVKNHSQKPDGTSKSCKNTFWSFAVFFSVVNGPSLVKKWPIPVRFLWKRLLPWSSRSLVLIIRVRVVAFLCYIEKLPKLCWQWWSSLLVSVIIVIPFKIVN